MASQPGPTPQPVAPASAAGGLSSLEAADLTRKGLANHVTSRTSRSLAEILKANLLTRFNALLGSLLVVILVVGPLQDAVFGLILVANALIGIAQEFRSKLALDRLALVAAPRALVLRDGEVRNLPASDVVQGDLVQISTGDQVVVDGTLESDEPLEVSEALLSGESTAIAKRRGDELLAGSFVSAGGGRYVATRVGDRSYAQSVVREARRFKMVRSELIGGINAILRVVTWLILPTAALLVYSQLRANPSLADAARSAVAGVITLVPEGLVLLTSASLALAVLRLTRRHVLVQQLPAVEMLARTDVVCLDKTGTLTELEMSVAGIERLTDHADLDAALGAMARVGVEPNFSMRAIANVIPAPPGWTAVESVPFSSSRKWSAARFEGAGWWVVGAPDVVVAGRLDDNLARRVERLAASGGRVLLLARAALASPEGGIVEPEPVALVSLGERIKPSAAATLKRFRDRGVAIKLISGDHPASVAAIAARVGLDSTSAVDGRLLPSDAAELLRTLESTAVVGRLTPEQKSAIVKALSSAGHTVAMVGDGVNDVLALKDADIGVAIGGGSPAARAVAACILLDGSFDGLPSVLDEGRRVIGNVERLASLFFTKTVYAFILAIAVGVATLPFPFLPRQLTLISAFTIGIPSVLLALARSFQPTYSGFLRRVVRFALPAGIVAAGATFAAYAMAVKEPNIPINEERTVATIVMAAIGLWVLARLARPLDTARLGLVAAMALALAATLMIPPARQFFELDFPGPIVILAATGIVALALVALEVADRALLGAARGHDIDEHFGPDRLSEAGRN